LKGSDVRIEKVSKSFGSFTAVKDVSLHINKGEFFSLLGPSGCGKTTILRMIAGFETPSTGRMFLDTADVTDVPSNRRHVNTVFQSYALFPHLTVFENVAFALRLKKRPKREIQVKVGEYLDLVQLNGQEKKMPLQLPANLRLSHASVAEYRGSEIHQGKTELHCRCA
jgi:ABC-type Fe3+/spermidine/putrescine transport system ATPase subunit